MKLKEADGIPTPKIIEPHYGEGKGEGNSRESWVNPDGFGDSENDFLC